VVIMWTGMSPRVCRDAKVALLIYVKESRHGMLFFGSWQEALHCNIERVPAHVLLDIDLLLHL